MIDWALIDYYLLLVVGGAHGLVVGSAGRVSSFGTLGRTNRPVPELAPSLNYLAQVLSAFKAVSADAFVE